VLAGGEGRRMQGQDKGLVHHQGRPLAAAVLQAMAAQTPHLCISANRHLPDYIQLLNEVRPGKLPGEPVASNLVWPDDPDLPPHSGPLAGILTALRRCTTDWLLCVPCDMPYLPPDLLARMQHEAERSGADLVVASTQPPGEAPRHHWVCALVNKRTAASTHALFMAGERKVGNWVRAQQWASVSFDDINAFANMNTPETLHA
jgi:molybdopterin-guanine dinucleotide biosynthesis protein A